MAVALALAATAASALAVVPGVSEELPLTVEKTTATLGAQVNPNSLATTYRFEYGSQGPCQTSPCATTAAQATPGSGSTPEAVSASIAGLQEGTTYHFRVVAVNSSGTTLGADQTFETLNHCGLAEERCDELVSPPDKGLAGEAGQAVGLGLELPFQAALSGNAFAYDLAFALPESTYGGETLYRSNRGTDGWSTEQLSPSLVGTAPSQQASAISSPTLTSWLSSDLECGFVLSSVPLTADAAAQPAREVREAGLLNLYRRNPDGSYTLVTNLKSTNLTSVASTAVGEPFSTFKILAASEDCRRVVFETPYKYLGVPFNEREASNFVYEWNNGVLSDPYTIPSPSGPVAPTGSATPGGKASYWQALSENGSRFYFTATSNLGGDTGQKAVFLREDGKATVDVSQSQTATPNQNSSSYQMATPDGAQVFFTGRYGLATNATSTGATVCTPASGSGAGCDLYRHSAATGTLTDLSADANVADIGGAGVAGVLDVSEDGSYVYFAARGQLVPGKGNTEAQNLIAPGAYNVYLWHVGAQLSYVATVLQTDVTVSNGGSGLLASPEVSSATAVWSSRATPDGKHLVFQSARNVTGYNSGGVVEAYLYSAESGATVCVSCRRDGQSPHSTSQPPLSPLGTAGRAHASHPRLSISADGSRVFFSSQDPLAAGAVNVSNAFNVYEWHNGQIVLLAAAIPGVPVIYQPTFLGASSDGDSIFFRTRQSLVPQDTDGRQDVYVARVGGGFAPPPSPAAPCEALSESSCPGATTATSAATAPASSTFTGPGNQAKHKSHKHKHKHKSKKHKSSKARTANTDRRAAK
jgi:hypothetical protein